MLKDFAYLLNLVVNLNMIRLVLFLAFFAVYSEGLLWSIPKNIQDKSIIEKKEKYCWYLFGVYHKCLTMLVKQKAFAMADEGTKKMIKKKMFNRPTTKIKLKNSNKTKNTAIQHVLRL